MRTVPFSPASYAGFLVPRPLLPFEAEGSARFTFRGRQESGDLLLSASREPSYRIKLLARLTGALALEVRFDRKRMMVVDYVNEAYFRGANTRAAREALFSFDLTPEEFQTLFTGRVESRRFQAGGGTLRDNEAVFTEGGARHRFRLDGHGLPVEWVKDRGGRIVFRAEFREYLALPLPGGIPLRVPRKVRLARGTGEDGGQGDTRIVLGIRSFRAGVESIAPLSLRVLPPGAAGFSPDLLSTPAKGG